MPVQTGSNQAAGKEKISVVICSLPDRSVDFTIQNLKEIRPKNVTMEIIIVKGKWLPIQRNIGAEHSTGHYIFYFDDDLIIPKGSIESALATFKNNPQISALGGPNVTPPKNTFLQHCFGYALASWFVGFNTATRYWPSSKIKNVTESNLTGCNMAFTKSTLDHTRFDPHLMPNEENNLLEKLRLNGKKLAYDAGFIVYHHRRPTLKKYIRQIYSWGKGRTDHILREPDHFRIQYYVPVLFALYLLSLLFCHHVYYLLPLFLYLILIIAFSLQTTFRAKNIAYIFVMPFIFTITHLAYAAGLIAGFFTMSHPPQLPPKESFTTAKINVV